MRKLVCCLSVATIAVLMVSEAFSAPPRGGRGRAAPAYRGAPPHARPPAAGIQDQRPRPGYWAPGDVRPMPNYRSIYDRYPGPRPAVTYRRHTPGWYATHPGSWWATHNYRPIRYATWAGLAGWVGLNAAPIYYNYGYDGTEAVVTYPDDEYYTANPFETDQPQYDFEAGQENANWYPLGMFGLVPPGHTDATAVLQLALAKDGTVAGTYQDVLTDKIHQLHGKLDKQTQKVWWSLDTNKSIRYETGLHNLVEPTTALIVDFGDNKKQKWSLERMDFDQPETETGE